jgi:hypothetical protein
MCIFFFHARNAAVERNQPNYHAGQQDTHYNEYGIEFTILTQGLRHISGTAAQRRREQCCKEEEPLDYMHVLFACLVEVFEVLFCFQALDAMRRISRSICSRSSLI